MAIFEKTPEVLLQSLRQEKCVLFIGSGISIISGLPGWFDIIKVIKSKLRSANRENLKGFDFLQLAQFYEDIFGRSALLDLLVKLIRKPGISSNTCHDLITRLPLRTIITTNWDTLLEQTYKKKLSYYPFSNLEGYSGRFCR